jgi:hypothetical protein
VIANARAKRRFASIILLAVPLALLVAARYFDNQFGLVGQYYANPEWRGQPASRVDRQITTLLRRLPGEASQYRPFSAQWDGYLYVVRTGRYRFQLISDDGAWLEIDGQSVVDNGGHHAPLLREQTIDLTAGPHPVRVRFFQGEGDWRIDLLWAREGEQPQPVAVPWLVNVPMGPWTHATARTLHTLAPYLPLCWLVAIALLIVDVAAPRVARWRIAEQLHDPWLWRLVAASAVLNACGIWWGLRGGAWAADEILPVEVLTAVERKFSGGWFGPYPPLHFYVLGLLYLPFLAAEWIMNLQINPVLHLLNRAASLVMAAAVVALAYLCAKTLSDRIGGLAAAALTATLLPFVYYAKTGNVDTPYLFWFCWAMLFYTRILVSNDIAAYAGFAISAALAVATKDQAYGYFVGPALHIAVLRYSRVRNAVGSRTGAIRDLVVPAGAAIGVVTFALVHNVVFNWTGFVRHIALITRNGGDRYRMFAHTWDGQLDLMRQTIELVRFSFGWPAFILVGLAVVGSIVRPEQRRRLWLLLPAASYYALFLAVVSIVFDRFVLGICILLAIIGGCAIADWTKAGRRIRLATAASAGIIGAYSLVRAASIDAMMVADSRYRIEDWIAERVPAVATIDSTGPEMYLPRVNWTRRVDADEPAAVSDADYVVINATHAQRYESSSEESTFYDRLRYGGEYTLAFRYRTAIDWSPLSRDPVFEPRTESPFTNLDKINPLMEIYRRRGLPEDP